MKESMSVLSFYSKSIYSVSLARLVDFDWRVDVKTASDSISRMSVPTCILQMKVIRKYCFPQQQGIHVTDTGQMAMILGYCYGIRFQGVLILAIFPVDRKRRKKIYTCDYVHLKESAKTSNQQEINMLTVPNFQ